MLKSVLLVVIAAGVTACAHKDADIKESIQANAKTETMFAGISYTVAGGAVTLTGNCPSQELKQKLIKRIESVGGVKRIVDEIRIAPVLLDNDFVVKQKVDSVLATYPGVESTVSNGVITLHGQLARDRSEKLVDALRQLGQGSVVNKTSVQ
jgi:hyperosmotically inducible periplasmic protein